MGGRKGRGRIDGRRDRTRAEADADAEDRGSSVVGEIGSYGESKLQCSCCRDERALGAFRGANDIPTGWELGLALYTSSHRIVRPSFFLRKGGYVMRRGRVNVVPAVLDLSFFLRKSGYMMRRRRVNVVPAVLDIGRRCMPNA